MARIRTIKPDAFTSDSLSAVSVAARWTFAGLWTYADDHGRARDDLRLIKAALFVLDDAVSLQTLATYLKELEQHDHICRYVVDGKAFLHMPKWRDHQRVSHPTESKFPPCPEHLTNGSRTAPEPLRNDSGSLPNDSSGKGKEGKGRERKGTGRTRAQSARPLPPDWTPNDSHRERAKSLELDLDEQVKRFREYFEETGDKHKSWDLTFTNWLRRTAQWGDGGPSAPAAGPTRPNTGPRDYVPREVPDHIDPDDVESYRKWMREATQ